LGFGAAGSGGSGWGASGGKRGEEKLRRDLVKSKGALKEAIEKNRALLAEVIHIYMYIDT